MFRQKISQLRHFGPVIVILLISWIASNGFNCLRKWFPWDLHNPLSVINFTIACFWLLLVLYNYFQCIFLGPGYVPANWRPNFIEHEKYLQYCEICQSFKVPRAHHCRTCQRCVLKFDHHCPWINTCLGYKNHACFCWFLLSSILGCIHALLIICPCVYRVLFIPYMPWKNEPRIDFTTMSLMSSILSIGLAIGVIIALGLLLLIQLKNIAYNRTTVENRIIRKANDRHREQFIYPYDLGFQENLRQVFNWKDCFRLVGDGLTWPVRSDCDQYTLSREQLEQEVEHEQQAVRYKAIRSYDGSFFPLIYGLRTCIHIPYSIEPRLRINQRDYLLVTRWQRYWLYGKFLMANQTMTGCRGWFPRCCVIQHLNTKKKLS
ncbi:unnamed protein product [Adineta ricciae]|uniref:Palmitoyltransferase n=1 Tax=Adineta ricciae TaxID=249248 RepID=A0A814VW36_ADIRI|nr:unnamed protein product [Adineta ricciae]